MGAGWRCAIEKLKQKNPALSNNNFVPTQKNASYKKMLSEAGEYAKYVDLSLQDIAKVNQASMAMLSTSKIVMSAPLPRGDVPQPGLIGGERFNPEQIMKVPSETDAKVDTEVVAPMQQWLRDYKNVTKQSKELEKQRLEFDSRRREVFFMSYKLERQRTELAQMHGTRHRKAKLTLLTTIHSFEKKLQHKERKLEGAERRFNKLEPSANERLKDLIGRSASLKLHLATAMCLYHNAFAAAKAALGPVH